MGSVLNLRAHVCAARLLPWREMSLNKWGNAWFQDATNFQRRQSEVNGNLEFKLRCRTKWRMQFLLWCFFGADVCLEVSQITVIMLTQQTLLMFPSQSEPHMPSTVWDCSRNSNSWMMSRLRSFKASAAFNHFVQHLWIHLCFVDSRFSIITCHTR